MGQTARFQETLRRLAMIDERFVEDQARLDLPAAWALDPKTAALLRVAACVAAGAPPVCLEWSAGRALAAGASEDEIADVLLAIAPVTGLGCVVCAAPEVAIALGYDTQAIEFLGTFVLVTVAGGAGVINHYAGGNPISRAAAVIAPGARSVGHNAAIAVGGTVALLGLFASPISGASMNPARSLGPDIAGNDYTGWWVYIAGPVIGAAIAVVIIGLVRGLPDKAEREAAPSGELPVPGNPPSSGS